MEAYFNSVLSLLGKIPGTFGGIVVGSFFTLLGIYLTNLATDRRQKVEREMAFRKEIYTAATEAISRSLSSISKFCDLSYSMKELATMQSDQAAIIAKVNLVAGEDIIGALTAYGTEFGMVYMRLSQQRMAFDVLQAQIAMKAGYLRGFEKTRDMMLELMQQHNIDAVDNTRKFETLRGIYDCEAGRIATMSKEIQQMTHELAAKVAPFGKECFADSMRLNKLLVPALVAVRKELGLSISMEQYSEMLNYAQSKVEPGLDDFIKNVNDFRTKASSVN